MQLVSVSLDFCRISDVMPTLDNLSVISVSQHWSISYHSQYCAFVLNVSVLITPPVLQSSNRSERLRFLCAWLHYLLCAFHYSGYSEKLKGPGIKSLTVQEIFSSPEPSRQGLEPTQSSIPRVRRLFPVYSGRAKVRNEWSSTPICLHGVARANFAFTQFINISDPRSQVKF